MAKDKKLTEKEKEVMHFIIAQTIDDDNNWDYMTGRELNARLKAYKANDCSENLIRIISCLRLAPVFYLRKMEEKNWTTLVVEEENEKFILAFSTKKHVPKELLTDCKLAQMSFREFVDSFDGLVTGVAINPETDSLYIPIEQLNTFFSMMDSVEKDVDDMMSEGITGGMLNELTFERFWGRNLYCEKMDGTKVSGEADSYDYDGDELVLKVKTGNGVIGIKKAEVAFIKDMGYSDEE